MSLDLLIVNARLPEGGTPVDIAVRDGRIVEVAPGIAARGTPAAETIDAAGNLVSPPFVDAHFHMDFDPLLRHAADQPLGHAA